MMDRIERLLGLSGEARVIYKDADFEAIGPGDFVRCAVTGDVIKVDDIKYWSVVRQEASANPQAALKRHQELLAKAKA